jgi:hypothetical protein
MRQRILPEVLATLREKFPIEFEKMEEIVHRPPINLCAWMVCIENYYYQ